MLVNVINTRAESDGEDNAVLLSEDMEETERNAYDVAVLIYENAEVDDACWYFVETGERFAEKIQSYLSEMSEELAREMWFVQ